jgi:putative NADH-flavin reductase
MILTVFGATGQVGKRIVSLALAKGYKVKAFSRDVSSFIDEELRNENFIAIQGHVFEAEEVLNAINESDAVLSALGGSFDGTDKTRSLGIKTIIEQMNKANVKRIVALGGMGVLNDEVYQYIINRPGYPDIYKPVGNEHLQAYLYLKESSLDWTFVCSPDIKNENASGNYASEAEAMPSSEKGYINAGDIADCMLKCIEHKKFVHHRVGIAAL